MKDNSKLYPSIRSTFNGLQIDEQNKVKKKHIRYNIKLARNSKNESIFYCVLYSEFSKMLILLISKDTIRTWLELTTCNVKETILTLIRKHSTLYLDNELKQSLNKLPGYPVVQQSKSESSCSA